MTFGFTSRCSQSVLGCHKRDKAVKSVDVNLQIAPGYEGKYSFSYINVLF